MYPGARLYAPTPGAGKRVEYCPAPHHHLPRPRNAPETPPLAGAGQATRYKCVRGRERRSTLAWGDPQSPASTTACSNGGWL